MTLVATSQWGQRSKELHIAPMLNYSTREFRQLLRILSRRAVIWTEMVVDETIAHAENLEEVSMLCLLILLLRYSYQTDISYHQLLYPPAFRRQIKCWAHMPDRRKFARIVWRSHINSSRDVRV